MASRFIAELKAATDEAVEYADNVWRLSVAELFNQVVEATPVDTSAAKRSWLMGSSNTGRVGNSIMSVQPQEVSPIGRDTLLFSNLPYMIVLEDGLYPQPGTERTVNGYSAQAPKGMVKVAASRWPSIVRKYNK